MKLNVPKEFIGEVRDMDGKLYSPVKGCVEIPDDKVSDNLWSYGFTRCAIEVVSKLKD